MAPLIVCDPAGESLLFRFVNALAKNQLEQDEEGGRLVGPLKPTYLGALPRRAGHVVRIKGFLSVKLIEGSFALDRVNAGSDRDELFGVV